MAGTPPCQNNDGLDADFVIGNVSTGEQLFLCAGDTAHFGLTMALQLLDPAEIINAAQAISATPPANGASVEVPPARAGRKRATKKKPAPELGPEPALPPEQAAGED